MDGERTPPNDDGLERARRALRETSSIEDALEVLRRAGPLVAPAREPCVRVAAAIGHGARAGAIASLLAQTDFVTHGDEHARLVDLAARLVLAHAPRDVAELRALREDGDATTLGEAIDAHARLAARTSSSTASRASRAIAVASSRGSIDRAPAARLRR